MTQARSAKRSDGDEGFAASYTPVKEIAEDSVYGCNVSVMGYSAALVLEANENVHLALNEAAAGPEALKR
jgi:hypothetical protein